MKKLLCLGYGYTAKVVVRLLLADGKPVAGTTRRSDAMAAIAADGVTPLLWSDDAQIAEALRDVDALLVSTPPDDTGCPAFNSASAAIARSARQLSWIGYLSSNGVYGDHSGAWVDETTQPAPTGERGRRRLAAENAWRALAKTHALPLVILRLPGIYGPGRSAFDRLRAGDAKRTVKPGQVFSRAHVDDIAAAVKASLLRPDAGALFNIADDEPAPPQDVVAYAAGLLGVTPPPETPLNEAALSPMAKSFWADNKRVSNREMKEKLGVTLAYPSYREGLKSILAAERQLS